MNAQTKPKPTASETNGGDSHLKKFAAELGAPWLDPIPPAQYLQFASDPDCEPWLRVWATILARTTKKPLTIEDIAKGLKMDEGNARRALRRLLVQNRVRRDEEGRLWLAGVFELPRGPQPLNPDDDPAAILERSVTDLFKPYYARQIMRLKPHIIKELVSEREARGERSRFRLADVVAAGRLMDDRDDNVTMARYGINLIRETHDLPADKRAEIDARRLRAEDLIPVLEKHVQAFYKPVSKRSVTKGKSALLQTFEIPHAHAATPGEHKSSVTAPRVLSEQQKRGGATFVNGSNNGAPLSVSASDLKKREFSSVPSENRTEPNSSLLEQRTEQLKELLMRWLGTKLSPDSPGPPVLAGILEALGDTDLTLLAQRIQTRLDSITSYWMVVLLAKDAAKLAQAPKTEAQSQPKPQTAADKFAEEYNARKSSAR
jgi:hypothetical protein